jgi:uncharacterized membrane protein
MESATKTFDGVVVGQPILAQQHHKSPVAVWVGIVVCGLVGLALLFTGLVKMTLAPEKDQYGNEKPKDYTFVWGYILMGLVLLGLTWILFARTKKAATVSPSPS